MNHLENILAAFISELPEGVLICNTAGEMLLYNRRAREFLESGTDRAEYGKDSDMKDMCAAFCTESAEFPAGPSVYTLIDKSLIQHAMDEISDKLKHHSARAVSHFIVEGKEKAVLQVRAIPVLNPAGQFTEFVLILTDITRQREADQRVDALLKSLTRSARSPLASIRSAIEILREYPDMTAKNLRRFKEIIYKESVTLSHLLNKAADEYSALVKNRWSRAPVSCEELMETLSRRAADTLNIRVSAEPLSEKLWVKVDTYSITAALLFVLNQLKEETGTREFSCKFEKEKKFVNLGLRWQGSPAGQEMIKKWEDCFLSISGEKSPLTLKEVLVHHEAEMWCCGSGKSQAPHICFLLPTVEKFESDDLKDTRILPESRPEFDIFSHPENPEPDSRLLTELSYTVLIREISEITEIEDLIAKPAQLPGLIHNMLSGGATMRNVTWLITTFSDAVLKRLIDFAIQDAGPPPVKFAFIVLGSEGRKEQTLKTDQDNAIIFEDRSAGEENAIAYFSALGEKICTWLDRAGYAFCEGDIMAKNPKWCQPLSVWKKYFSDWIRAAEPEDLFHSSIFFDFRFISGDPELVAQLRDYLFTSLTGWSGFFRHMTENTVCFKPPLSFLGNFIVETKGAHRNSLDIKRPMTQIVDFARICALRHGVQETNTQERLYRLCLKNVLTRETYHETEQAYSYMMQLRFARQIAAVLDENTKPDNYIDPGKLSAIERKMLKEAFKRVEKTQTKLSFDFIGMSDSHMK